MHLFKSHASLKSTFVEHLKVALFFSDLINTLYSEPAEDPNQALVEEWEIIRDAL